MSSKSKNTDNQSTITTDQLATYPVMLREYDPNWTVIFEEEKEKLRRIAGDSIEDIFHFGSTSIPGMLAKPTVDILVILKEEIDLDAFCKRMLEAEYLCTKYPDKTKKRKNCMNFVVPYTVDGVEQYKCYIHIRENDVPRPELLFAKYLREHPEAAKEYGECGGVGRRYGVCAGGSLGSLKEMKENNQGGTDMKKATKLIIFVVALLCNTAFLLLCGYGQIHHEDTATYWDPALGVVAVLVLALGNVGVAVQLYFRIKYRHLKCRAFDWKFWRQCLLLAIYYAGSLWYLSAMTYEFMVSYLSLFAIALSPLWLLGGSRTLWRAKDGGESYYLDDLGKWYVVHDVTENDNVVELKCTAPGDRDRTVTIEKKR